MKKSENHQKTVKNDEKVAKNDKKPLKRYNSIDKTERVVQELVENGRSSVSGIMREVGFGQGYAAHPERLKATLKFQKLLKKYLPEKRTTIQHGALIEAGKLDHYTFPATDTDDMIRAVFEGIQGVRLVRIQGNSQWKRAYFMTPDNDARLRAIEMAYKLYNRLGTKSLESDNNNPTDEIREVLVRVRQILPHSDSG